MDDNKQPDEHTGNRSIEPVSDRSWVKKLEEATGKPVTRPVELVSTGATVYLVLDISESMSNPAKINQAKQGAHEFASDAIHQHYDVGLITFSTDAREICSSTKEAATIASCLVPIATSGITNMSRGISLAAGILSQKRGVRVICLFTDSWPNDPAETIRAVEQAKGVGIDIMTMGTQDADYEFLSTLASRKHLAQVVPNDKIRIGIKSMAQLLPPPKDM